MYDYCVISRVLIASCVLACAVRGHAVEIPLSEGLIFTSALQAASGDRESVVTLTRVDSAGVSYSWSATQRTPTGELERGSFHRFVRATDLEKASCLNSVFISDDRMQYPGSTAFSFSSAIHDALREKGEAPFTVVSKGGASIDGAQPMLSKIVPQTIKLKGKLTLSSRKPVSFPLLIDGERAAVLALAVRGRFQFQEQSLEQEFLVLDQRSHPLVLRVVTGNDVYQVIRVDHLTSSDARLAKREGTPEGAEREPGDAAPGAGESSAAAGGGAGTRSSASAGSSLARVERALQKSCRAELPGIYFEFARADLTSESQRTIAALATMIERHPDWTLSIEGHTDDIGSASDNQRLSEARAGAVRARLTEFHRIAPQTLAARGFGETQPREPNTTLEGRARNRRVELVRPCANARLGARR